MYILEILFERRAKIFKARLSVHGISQQEYWSGLPFSPPGALPDSRIKPMSPALAGMFFTTEQPGKTTCTTIYRRGCDSCY